MATKKSKTTTKKKTPAKKAAAPVKAKRVRAAKPATPPKPRHPRARVVENHGSKEALAKSLAPLLARDGEDADTIESNLKRASNAQLLRLSRVTATVKQRYGSRDAMIAAIGAAKKKTTDQDYLTRLAKFSLPQLLDLATSSERRAKA